MVGVYEDSWVEVGRRYTTAWVEGGARECDVEAVVA